MKYIKEILLAVCYHPDRSFDHRQCDSRDIILLIYHVTPRDQMFKDFLELMDVNM